MSCEHYCTKSIEGSWTKLLPHTEHLNELNTLCDHFDLRWRLFEPNLNYELTLSAVQPGRCLFADAALCCQPIARTSMTYIVAELPSFWLVLRIWHVLCIIIRNTGFSIEIPVFRTKYRYFKDILVFRAKYWFILKYLFFTLKPEKNLNYLWNQIYWMKYLYIIEIPVFHRNTGISMIYRLWKVGLCLLPLLCLFSVMSTQKPVFRWRGRGI